ncbi:hypothetical protein VP01_272g4 [Puccinia sorghi]|uniref:Uncharacterized protein n=1 Tax=Puccinia sorghi TaxID=27349 RepID=A0A0L6V531_9BASI|nr:hypothetical protein VP01_272g4 [Puccinia sorghi]
MEITSMHTFHLVSNIEADIGKIYESGKQCCLPIAIINRFLTHCESKWLIQFLYKIACSFNKLMRARDLLAKDQGCLTFAILVFHAYGSNWLCQLNYHPQLNDGWGLLDGEGLERFWLYLSPLVSVMIL